MEVVAMTAILSMLCVKHTIEFCHLSVENVFLIKISRILAVSTRVKYDRVQNKKNNFEITVFLNYERGTSRAGNPKSNENNNVFVFAFI